MSTGDSRALTSIEELTNRIRSLEERVESCMGPFNWETFRPAQVGGIDCPADDGEVKRLASELKAKRPEITDVKKLHMVDMALHFFSVWPVLPQVTRRYAYNMGTLLIGAVTEGWNEATQRSNGFSPQLVVPVSNGHEPPVARSSVTAQVNGTQPAVVGVAQSAPPEPASIPAIASPSRMAARSPPGTPVKREAVDEPVGVSSPKVANQASTSSVSSPYPSMQSPTTQAVCPLTYKPKCDCKQPAYRLQVKKDNQNKGRFFYKCFKSAVPNPINPCEYFEWEDKLPVKAPKYCSHCGKPGHNKNNCPAK